MSKASVTNLVGILAVVTVVAGAAWFKSQQSHTPAEAPPEAPRLAPEAETEQPAPTPTEVPLGATPVDETQAAPPEAPPTADDSITETQAATVEVVAVEEPEPVEAAAEAKLPRLVDLGADKCKACIELAPILDALREEYKGRLSVEFIDVWKNPSAKDPYHIRLIPTQILFDKDGKEVWRHEGFISKADLKVLFAEKVGVR